MAPAWKASCLSCVEVPSAAKNTVDSMATLWYASGYAVLLIAKTLGEILIPRMISLCLAEMYSRCHDGFRHFRVAKIRVNFTVWTN